MPDQNGNVFIPLMRSSHGFTRSMVELVYDIRLTCPSHCFICTFRGNYSEEITFVQAKGVKFDKVGIPATQGKYWPIKDLYVY